MKEAIFKRKEGLASVVADAGKKFDYKEAPMTHS